MGWTLRNLNLKNCGTWEKIVMKYEIKVELRDEAIKLRKMLNDNYIIYRIKDRFFIQVFCDIDDHIKILKEIINSEKYTLFSENIAVLYEIETLSKDHTKRLGKMLYEKRLFYKIPHPNFVCVPCDHSDQIEKLAKVLLQFDRSCALNSLEQNFFIDKKKFDYGNGYVKLENNLERILSKISNKYGLENCSLEEKVYRLVKILERIR